MDTTADRLARVKELLGAPHWEAGSVLLYLGDALDFLVRLGGAGLDLVVTSPPYNIGKDYEAKMPIQDYVAWCATWFKTLHGAVGDAGAFWLNLGYVPFPGVAKAIPLPYLIWPHCPFHLVQEVVWNYGAGVASKRAFSPRNEKWLWYVKDPERYVFNLDAVRDPNVKYPNQKKNGKLRCNQAGKNPTDVWQIPKVTTGEGMTGKRASPERTAHPAQFPEAVVRRIVEACSDPGGLVLDPFAGSGTVGAVAAKTGRACVLFEIRRDYAEMAAIRIERAIAASSVKQLQLFDGA